MEAIIVFAIGFVAGVFMDVALHQRNRARPEKNDPEDESLYADADGRYTIGEDP